MTEKKKYRPLEPNYVDDGIGDYHFCCDIDTPREERDKMHMGDIYINAAICGECGEEIRSKNRHDYRSCSCGNISVDGGSHYCKRSCRTLNYKEKIVLFNDVEVSKPKEE